MDLDLLESVQKLELDHTETANNIKRRISDKVREYIQTTKKYAPASQMATNKHEFELIVPSKQRDDKESNYRLSTFR